MKQKRYHYAVLEIALYSSFGLFALEHAINTFAVEGWKIISVDEKFVIMEREWE